MLFFGVTPCVGVWIEIILMVHLRKVIIVTPCVGVWIEIEFDPANPFGVMGHSLRGSVD